MIKLISLNKMTLATESGNVSFNKGDKLKLQVDLSGNPYVVSEGTKRVTNGYKVVEKKVQFNLNFTEKSMFENFLKHVALESHFDLKESAKSRDLQKISIVNALVHEGLDSSKLVKGLLNGSIKSVSSNGKLESFEVPVKRINKSLSVREKFELIQKDKPVATLESAVNCKVNVLRVKKVRSVESLGYVICEDEMGDDSAVQSADAQAPASDVPAMSKEDLIAKITAIMSERGLTLTDIGLEDGQALDYMEPTDLSDLLDFLTDVANGMDSTTSDAYMQKDGEDSDDTDKEKTVTEDDAEDMEGDKDVTTSQDQQPDPKLQNEEDDMEDDSDSDVSFDSDDEDEDDKKSS